MLRHWLRRNKPSRAQRIAPQAEWLEPRLLYSADAGALLGVDTALSPAPEQRTLDASFEYGAEGAALGATPGAADVRAVYALTPLQFEADAGQLGDGVEFAASGIGYAVRLSGGNAELLLEGADQSVRLELVGGDPAGVQGEQLLATRSNYLVGTDPAGWITDIVNYGSVRYRDVYEGIDVRYYGNQAQLEYDFIVAAGADASRLVLRFDGVERTEITAEGDLLLQVAGSSRELRFAAPVSYQQGPGGREAVESRYELQGDGTVRIVVGEYDRTRELVVDPVLRHTTYHGDAGVDQAFAVAVGADGSVYVTGQTSSTAGTLADRIGANAGGTDLFVARFSRDLTTLLYSTRIGGNFNESGNAIAVDAAGNAIIVGTVGSGNFPTAGASVDQAVLSGTRDAVVLKLNDQGNALIFSTYFGGTGDDDAGNSVAVDASGKIYVAGTISVGNDQNAFLNVYDPTGLRLASNQFGGTGNDLGAGVAVDAAGRVYLVGTVQSTVTVPAGINVHETKRQGPDGFLVRYSAAGAMDWFSYVSSSNGDSATGVAVDGSGRAWVVGTIDSPQNGNFTLTAGALSTAGGSNNTGYLRVYDTNIGGSGALEYSTLIGGGGTDVPTGVAVLEGGRAVVVGQTSSINLPTTADAVRRTNGTTSGFALVVDRSFTGTNQLVYGTYFGSNATAGGVAGVGSTFYFVGSTTEAGLATTGVHDASVNGTDSFVAIFANNTAPVIEATANLAPIAEDSPAGAGTLVADLVTIRDPDIGAQPGIAIVAADSANGTWQYTLDGSTWQTFSTPASGNALLLAADATTRVRFVPAANFSGTSSIAFHAWDRTNGTAGVVRALGTGVGSAFSSAARTASVTVTPVNDLPVAQAASASGLEDAAAIAITLSGSDLEDGGVAGVKVLTAPANGFLYADAGLLERVVPGTVYSGGNFTFHFVPAADFARTATFTFGVVDGAGGESAPQTASITVTPVNDAPVAATAGATGLEDAASIAITLTGSDAEEGSVAGVRLLTLPANGVLYADASLQTLAAAGTVYAGASATFHFVPAADFHGSASFTFATVDGTGLQGSAATATIGIAPVNDAPTQTGGGVANIRASEGEIVALGLSDLRYSVGPANEAGQSIRVTITGLPGTAGSIQLADGTPVVLGQSYTLAELHAMRFEAGLRGTGTFSFRVADDGGTADGGQDALPEQSLQLTVTNVAPVLASPSNPFTQLEDVPGAGTRVLDLITGRVTDGAGAYGIAVTQVPDPVTINGQWQYSVDGGSTWAALTGSNAGARLLGPDARVRFVGDAGENVNGAVPGFTFRAWDGSSGVAGATANTNANGGFTAFSSETATAALTLTPVNDAPVRFDVETLTFLPAPANVTVNEATPASSLGLGTLEYITGYAMDEYLGQTLTYTVTGVPAPGMGTVLLADGVTAVTADTSYTLAQLQGMRFRPAAGVQNATGTFSWKVQDNGGTAGGGADTLLESITITVRNVAPTLAGANPMPALVEDAPTTGMRVADLIANKATDAGNSLGIAVIGAPAGPGGAWQYSSDGGASWASLGGASSSNAVLLSTGGQWRVRFQPAPNWNGTSPALTFRAWDRSTGVAGGTASISAVGGSTAFSSNTATATVSVGAVNDGPVRTDAPGVALPPLVLLDGSPMTPLGLAGITFGPGGGSDEAGQAIQSYRITSLPSTLGGTYLANGTPVALNQPYTLLDIQGMQFLSSGVGALGTQAFSFTVTDSGGTANGGTDTTTVTVNVVVNRAPVLQGVNSPLTVYEDFDWSNNTPSGTPPPWSNAGQRIGMLVSDLIAGHVLDTTGSQGGIAIVGMSGNGIWQFTVDGGNTWTMITSVDNAGALQLAADGQTRLRFLPSADFNTSIAPVSLTVRAWDQTVGSNGTYGDATWNGGPFAYSAGTAVSVVTITPRNDAPLPAGATGGSVEEGAAPAPLLAGGGFVPGPATATDEAAQTLHFTFTAIPDRVQILLADGTAVAADGTSYTYAQFQGMVFRSAPDAIPGTATVTLLVRDSGGTANGGADTLGHALTLTVTNRAPVLSGANPLAPLLEDSTDSGTAVADLIHGQVVDPTGTRGIAVVAADSSHGTWQYTRDGGTTWTTFSAPSAGSATLLLADASTRVRFVPAADWHGTAGLGFVAWDGTSGAAGGLANATLRGGASAFSSAIATASVTVQPVNDAPVGGTVADLTVAEDSGSTSLGLGAVAYGPGGSGYEAGQVLTITVVGLPDPALGRITLADGTAVAPGEYTLEQLRGMRFVTAANAVGTGSFSFQVRDDGGGTDTLVQAVAIKVTPVNDAPAAANDVATGVEDSPLTIAPATLLANDTDIDSPAGALTVTGVTSGTGGTVALVDGSIVFTPTANYSGPATFTYTVADGSGGTATATVRVDVAAVNDPPLARDDAYAAILGAVLVIPADALLANDFDLDGDTLTITGVNGAVTLLGNQITFLGPLLGSTSFTYTVSDGRGGTATGTVNVRGLLGNNAPVAGSDELVAAEDTALTLPASVLLDNDYDLDGGTPVITAVSAVSGGTVSLAGSTITFTPTADFNGTARFTYTINDGNGGTASGSVSVRVTAVNDPPVATADSLAAIEDQPLTIAPATLTGNDRDADGEALTLVSVASGIGGTVALVNGQVVFTPAANHSGEATFSYTVQDIHGVSTVGTVTVQVAEVNDAPVAAADTVDGTEDGTLTIEAATLLANDSDVEGDARTLVEVGNAVGGSVALVEGKIVFTPAPDLHGTGAGSFTYTLRDSRGGTATGTVTVNLASVNDAPVAGDDTATTAEDTPLTFTPATLLANDRDTEDPALAIAGVSSGAGGQVAIVDGNVVFTPDADHHGTATFSYTVRDADGATHTATVTVTVTPVNDAPHGDDDTQAGIEDTPLVITPAALLANDGDVDGDSLSIVAVGDASGGTVSLSGGNVIFVPDANRNGTGIGSFTYTVSDGQGGTVTRTVTVDIAAVNDAPLAHADVLDAYEDTPLRIGAGVLTGNDDDVEGAVLVITGVGNAAGGSVVLAGGEIVFTPDAEYAGVASFRYTVSDGAGGSSTGVVTLNVHAVNDAPQAADDAPGTTLEDTPLTVAPATLLVNDGDREGDALEIIAVADGVGGQVNIVDGEVVFTPDPDFFGTGGFYYTVSDGNGGLSTAYATVEVTAVNDAPRVTDDALAGTEDTAAVVTAAELLANDADVEGSALTLTGVTAVTGGTVRLEAGLITFTPAAHFNGQAVFTYTVQDADGETSTGTVRLELAPVDDAPQAADDTLDATEDEALTIAPDALLGNDAEFDNEALAIIGVSDAVNGSVALVNDQIVFTPAANFHGNGSFRYTVADGNGGTSTATVTIRVAAVNDGPVAQAGDAAVAEGGTFDGQVHGTDADAGDTLRYALVGGGAHGAVTVNADGTFSYTHNGSENFEDALTFEVTDAAGAKSQATVSIMITPVNDAPAAQTGTATVAEGGTVNGNVLGTDADAGDALRYGLVTGGKHGAVTLNADGTFSYRHNGSENFSDSFTFEVTDAAGAKSQASVSITITPVNDAPVAQAGTVSVSEGGTVSGNVLGTDADAGDTLRYTLVTGGKHGAVTLTAGGTFSYEHDGSENFDDAFTFEVTDAAGAKSQATVSIAITPVNDAPVAQAGTASVSEGGTVSGSVLGADADAGDTLRYTLVSGGKHGAVTIDADGTFSYQHDGSENFGDSFTFEVTDAAGAKSQATVAITVTPVNDAPVAQAGTATVLEGGTVSGNVLGTDPDAGDTLRYTLVTGGKHGSVTVNADGTFSYKHDGSENFSDSFTFEVTDAAGAKSQAAVAITTTPVNDAPVAQAGTAAVSEGGTVNGNVLGTDADAGETLRYTVVTGGKYGAVTMGPDGTFSYKHDGSENFGDSFTFEVTDAAGAKSQATVSITITPVNDAPVAHAGTATVAEGGTVNGNVLGTDADAGGTLSYTLVTGGKHGAVSLNADGTFSYKHDGSENFEDAFTFEVTDAAGAKSQATISITATPVNDAPVAQAGTATVPEGGTVNGNVLGTDADAGDSLRYTLVSGGKHGAVTIDADGTFSYQHDGSENFGDSFTFEVTDAAGAKSQATIGITITPVNDAPVAEVGSTTVAEGETVDGSVQGTDADAGDTLRYTLVTGGTHGAVTINADGTFSYTHDGSENFEDAFTFEVTDAAGAKSQATVIVTITPVNDAPAAQAGAATVAEGGTVNGNVLGTDADAGDTLRYTLVTGGKHGAVTVNADGTFSYTHDGSENFEDAFTFEVTDAAGAKSQATASITITPVNDAPAAQTGMTTVSEGGTVNGNVLGTDADAGDTLRYTLVSGGTHGEVTLNADGTFSYKHGGSENFDDAFTFEVTDAAGAKSQATVGITITPVNDAPAAQTGTATVAEGGTVNGNVLGTDTDAGDTLRYTLVTGGTHGAVTVNADGTFSYKHDGSENFDDAFTFEVTDAAGAKSQATVSITITPINDAPVAQGGTATVSEGGTVNGSVLGIDADASDTLRYTLVTGGKHGAVTLNADGTFSYEHDGSENFGDSFTFEVTDAAGAKSQASVGITIAPANDAPTAQAGTAAVAEGGTVSGNVLGTDADAGDTLRYTLVSGGTHGAVTLNVDGTFSYEHGGSENFDDAFTFEVTDAAGAKSQARVAITVAPVNDAPVAQTGTATVSEGGAVNGNVLGTDADAGDALRYTLVSGGTHGEVTLNADGTFSYKHDGSENFADAFTFEVTDAAGAKSQAAVSVTITPVNDAPAAQGGTATVTEGSVFNGQVLGTDADAGDTLRYTLVTGGTHGAVTVNADGTFSYKHDGSENFGDSFTFEVTDAAGAKSQATVSITITPVNDAPAAQTGTATAAEGGTVDGNVLGTDADAGDTLRYTLVTGGTHGAVTVNADGTFSYKHDGSENFSDAFTFEVTDAAGAKSQATVTITITPVNDAPVAQAGTGTVSEGGIFNGQVVGTDADAGDSLRYTLVSGGTHGAVTINADGTFSYKHDGSENFDDAFTFEVTDAAGAKSQATVSITITPFNDAPVAQAGTATVVEGGTVNGNVLGTDADAGDNLRYTLVTGGTHGSVTLNADGTFSYRHDGSENFSDAFTFEVADAAGTKSQASVSIMITPVNDAPVAGSDSVSATEDQPLAIDAAALLANDGDADDANLAITAVGAGSGGTVALVDGRIVFTPTANFNGAGSFTYTVADASGATATATVTVTVAPVNDAPAAGDDTLSATEDQALAIGAATLLANDGDLDADTLRIVGVRSGTGGTVVVVGNSIVFTPAAEFSGMATFIYTVSDGQGGTATATVTLNVAAVDDATVAAPDTATATEDTPVAGNVLANDSDVDSPLSVVSFRIAGDAAVHAAGSTATLAGIGAVTVQADGSYLFTPAADWNGAVPALSYTTSTGATQELRLTISPVNDAPVRTGAAQELSVGEGATVPLGFAGVSYGVGGGADEAALQTLAVRITSLPSALGTVVLADGTAVGVGGSYSVAQLQQMQFRAAPGATGEGLFAFTVADDGGGADSLADSLVVRVSNLAPVLEGVNALPSLREDAADNAGMLVGDLIAGRASDPAGRLGIAVTDAVAGEGQWEFSRDGGTSWSAFQGVSAASAELLRADDQTRIRFVPGQDWNGSAAGLAFRAWDRSGATADAQRADTTVHGGSTAFSAATARASVTVAAVNDAPRAPAGVPAQVAIVDGAATGGLAQLPWSYAPGGGQDEAGQSITITITQLPDAGLGTLVLADGRTPVRAGSSYSAEQLNGLQFIPAQGSFGRSGELAWVARDDGGTAGGGADSTAGQVRIVVLTQVPVEAPVPPVVSTPAPAPVPDPQVEDEPAAPAPAPAAPQASVRGRDSAGGALDAVGETTPPSVLMPPASEFAFTMQRFAESQETARILGAGPRLAGDFQLVALSATGGFEFELTGLNFQVSTSSRFTMEDFQQSLRSGMFVEELNRIREEMRQEFDLDKSLSISVAGLSLGVSVAYVLWLVRGGVLLGSYLSAMPAWRLLDPLPVLARAGDEEEDEEDETFDPHPEHGADPLRGFS